MPDLDDFEIDREALVQLFLAESADGLAALEQAVLALEDRPDDGGLVATLFRHAHTLKGNAATLGFTGTAELAHALEDLLDDVREDRRRATPALASLMLEAADALKALVALEAGGTTEMPPHQREVLARLRRTAATAEEPESTRPGSASAEVEALSGVAAGAPRSLRVDLARLDSMMNLVGELVVARGRLGQTLLDAGAGSAVLDAFRDAERLSADLHDLVLKIRMVPLGPTFRQLARTVRDLAVAAGKEARLTVEGAEVEVDTSVIEKIRDPLTHMVRNALDHGIEPPDVRRAQGKDPVGTVALRAHHEGGTVVVELSDDGAGLGRQRILERARQRGLVADGEALGDHDIQELIFKPGFSTAHGVTDVSGRGVGMDVVRRNVTALRGTVDVASREGEGLTVTIRLPLTLAIVPGLLVAAGGERYVVPLDNVVECVDLPAGGARTGQAGIADLRGEPVPYLSLRRLLGGRQDTPERESLVVVEQGERIAGLAVDGLLGEADIVVKPMGHPLQAVRGVAGSTILGDGRVALILDVAALLREAGREQRA